MTLKALLGLLLAGGMLWGAANGLTERFEAAGVDRVQVVVDGVVADYTDAITPHQAQMEDLTAEIDALSN